MTDIDVVNKVYHRMDAGNIYQYLVQLIKAIATESDIIMIFIICGTDERFQLNTVSDTDINAVKPLLKPDELAQLDNILAKYKSDPDRQLFYANELIREYYKIRWLPGDIITGYRELRTGIVANFSDILRKQSSFVIQYICKIRSYYIGFDVVIIYDKHNLKSSYEKAADYHIKLAGYNREYYYMLFPFRYYFRHNKAVADELENIIETKYGLYKQLMVRIDVYHLLLVSKNLNILMARCIVSTILHDLKNLTHISSNIPDKLREVVPTGNDQVVMAEWDLLLAVLYDEINASFNLQAKQDFHRYLKMMPTALQQKYYLVLKN